MNHRSHLSLHIFIIMITQIDDWIGVLKIEAMPPLVPFVNADSLSSLSNLSATSHFPLPTTPIKPNQATRLAWLGLLS